MSLSRGSHGLIVLGSQQTFYWHETWRRLLDKFKYDETYMKDWETAKEQLDFYYGKVAQVPVKANWKY